MNEMPSLIDIPLIFYTPLFVSIFGLNWFAWKVPEVLIPMIYKIAVYAGLCSVMEMLASFSDNKWMLLLNFINMILAMFLWAIVLSLSAQWLIKKLYQKIKK